MEGCGESEPEDCAGQWAQSEEGIVDVRGGACTEVCLLHHPLHIRPYSQDNSETITDTTHIPPPDWEALIEQIARQIVEERSPQRLLQVRASLYDLLSHCIDSTTILKTLTWKLIPKTDDALKPEVIKWAAFYEHRCKMGSKQIFHLEAFVAKYMRLYERYAHNRNKVIGMWKLTCAATPWASTLIQPKQQNHAHLLNEGMYGYEGYSNFITRTDPWRFAVSHTRARSSSVYLSCDDVTA